MSNNNNTIELHKIKIKKTKNTCFSHGITKNKSNMNNNGIENMDKNFPHHLLLPKENKSHMPIPLLNISTSSNNIHNNEKDSKNKAILIVITL